MTSWEHARTVCQSEGGDLVTILNESVNSFLYEKIKTKNPADAFWVGLKYKGNRGGFFWLDYISQASFFAWGPNQPNRGAQANCISINYYDRIESWRNNDCRKRSKFICEKFADCIGGTYQGMLCPKSCSPNCKGDGHSAKCDPRTGDCFLDCNDGYKGALCTEDNMALTVTEVQAHIGQETRQGMI
ncbi:C-type mannose receptor 2 [Elysia marginata]|uniref:C-type mannose receptor 2 n=1 Tax=Elysia marginata TaxID=1093978 RepID=A0AAV4EA25_9GAST|nr:C-type mannose receptor 2 [Elysia marginata]